MDAAKTAVVLVEFQNDFTSDGGALHGAVAGVMDATDMLTHARAAADAARAAGATVIHSPIQFAEGYYEITSTPYGILKGVVDTNAFVKGSWGAEIGESLAVLPARLEHLGPLLQRTSQAAGGLGGCEFFDRVQCDGGDE